MVFVDELKPGDVVKIVDEWSYHTCENSQGLMDEWLGKAMTVNKIDDCCAIMEEDMRWRWNSYCIDYVISPDDEVDDDFDGEDDEAFDDFLKS